MADGLTKTAVAAPESLIRALTLRVWKIQYDERFVSAKKKRQKLRQDALEKNKLRGEKRPRTSEVLFLEMMNGTYCLTTRDDVHMVTKEQCMDAIQKKRKGR